MSRRFDSYDSLLVAVHIFDMYQRRISRRKSNFHHFRCSEYNGAGQLAFCKILIHLSQTRKPSGKFFYDNYFFDEVI